MLIRGLDFGRHHVIVGTDGESPVPNSSQVTQPKGELVARVIAASGGEATLDLDGQRVVVESHVPLSAGDKLYVRVAESAPGVLRLSILASGPEGDVLPQVPDADLDALLRSLGLPADERHRNAARALLARDGTLDMPALKKLLGDLRQFPQVDARTATSAALLQKAGSPVTPSAVALLASRAEPESPPQMAARLMPLRPALELFSRGLPARSPLAPVAAELLDVLQGLPLDEQATPAKVEQALGRWLERLQPPRPETPPHPASAPGRGAGVPLPHREEGRGTPLAGQTTSPAPTAPAMPAAPTASATPAAPAGALLATAPQALPTPKEVAAAATPLPTPQALEATVPKATPQAPQAPQAPTPPSLFSAAGEGPSGRASSATRQGEAQAGLKAKAAGPAPRDLASLLEKLEAGLGTERGGLKQLVREALAEVRYAQIVNGPPPEGTERRPEFMVPLLLPQLHPDQPEGRIQVYHKPGSAGAEVDPRNVRLVFVLETEHLGTLQADLTIKDGVIDLALGAGASEDRAFLAAHLDELKAAIARHGFETGRFATRVAKRLPPPVRQEEGLVPVVRFDRRV